MTNFKTLYHLKKSFRKIAFIWVKVVLEKPHFASITTILFLFVRMTFEEA